jgi:hypothetical protein
MSKRVANLIGIVGIAVCIAFEIFIRLPKNPSSEPSVFVIFTAWPVALAALSAQSS